MLRWFVVEIQTQPGDVGDRLAVRRVVHLEAEVRFLAQQNARVRGIGNGILARRITPQFPHLASDGASLAAARIVDAGQDVMNHGTIARHDLNGTNPDIAPERIGGARILIVDYACSRYV